MHTHFGFLRKSLIRNRKKNEIFSGTPRKADNQAKKAAPATITA
jgi:hypothetical protein